MTQEPDRPDLEGEPPPEPFEYLSSPGRLREPWALIISSSLLVLFGVWVLVLALVTNESTGGRIMATAIMIVMAVVGGFGIYVGIRRLQWKRRVRRLTGHDPWRVDDP